MLSTDCNNNIVQYNTHTHIQNHWRQSFWRHTVIPEKFVTSVNIKIFENKKSGKINQKTEKYTEFNPAETDLICFSIYENQIFASFIYLVCLKRFFSRSIPLLSAKIILDAFYCILCVCYKTHYNFFLSFIISDSCCWHQLKLKISGSTTSPF